MNGRLRTWTAKRPHRIALGSAAAACFVVAGVLVGLALAGVTPFASPPPPATFTLASRIRIELAEAAVLASNQHLAQAVAVYDSVLALDPSQPEALADGGWITRLAGLASKSRRVVTGGDDEIAAAVKVAPTYALARAYDGVALFVDDHSPRRAAGQFSAMLADRPSATLIASVGPTAIAAYRAAGLPPPAAFSRR